MRPGITWPLSTLKLSWGPNTLQGTTVGPEYRAAVTYSSARFLCTTLGDLCCSYSTACCCYKSLLLLQHSLLLLQHSLLLLHLFLLSLLHCVLSLLHCVMLLQHCLMLQQHYTSCCFWTLAPTLNALVTAVLAACVVVQADVGSNIASVCYMNQQVLDGTEHASVAACIKGLFCKATGCCCRSTGCLFKRMNVVAKVYAVLRLLQLASCEWYNKVCCCKFTSCCCYSACCFCHSLGPQQRIQEK